MTDHPVSDIPAGFDPITWYAELLARDENFIGRYWPRDEMSDFFEWRLDFYNVPPIFRVAVKQLAGNIVEGHRGSAIARWQGNPPFHKRPPWIAGPVPSAKELQLTGRKTERGELMSYFCRKCNKSASATKRKPMTMAWMGKILEGIPTEDLYYIQQVCETKKYYRAAFRRTVDFIKSR